MKKTFLLISTILLGIIIFASPLQAVPTALTSVNDNEWRVLALVNKERIAAGLQPLTMTDALQKAADIREQEIFDAFSHTRPNGSNWYTTLDGLGIDYNSAGENIAAGQASPEEVMTSWMNSSGHRANILNGKFTHMGAGYAKGSGMYGTSWVQLFTGNCAAQSIAMAAPAGNRTFPVGTSADDFGETVVVTCVHGNSYLPLISEMTSGYNPSVSGRQTVTVTYGNLTTSFEVVIGTDAGTGITPVVNEDDTAFYDVPANTWYTTYVNDLVQRGLINGKSPGYFGPEDNITRAELAKILAMASGESTGDYGNMQAFSDIPKGKWYTQYVNWAATKGIALGDAGKFYPDANISRQEIAVMLQRYADTITKTSLPITADMINFSDQNAIADWAADAVLHLQQAGIINGMKDANGSDCFAPNAAARRCEVAKMISIFLRLN